MQQVVVDLRRSVYDKLQRLSFRFFDANSTGSIITRVTGDVQAVRMFLDQVMIQSVIMVISLGAYIVFMGLNILGVKLAATFELIVCVLAVAELLVFMGVVAPAFSFSSFALNGWAGSDVFGAPKTSSGATYQAVDPVPFPERVSAFPSSGNGTGSDAPATDRPRAAHPRPATPADTAGRAVLRKNRS